jgi:hypothetical protein
VIPEDYSMEHLREWAKTTCPLVDFDWSIAKLRVHEFQHPRTNWDVAAQKWLMGDEERARRSQQDVPPTPQRFPSTPRTQAEIEAHEAWQRMQIG